MPKHFKSLVFSFLLAIFLILILAPGCLASAMDYLDIQVPFGELPAKLKIDGSMFANYIKALFVFASAAITVFAIIMMMAGGVQWILSEGTPDKIGKAKDTIFKAFIGLFIALFSIFILQIVNPGAVDFKLLTVEKIEGMNCCQFAGKLEPMSDEDCIAQQGKILPPSACVGNLALLNTVATSTCTDDQSKECGSSYMDGSIACIGKKCDDTSTVCTSKDNKWECAKCKEDAVACQADTECCSGSCKDDKCTKVADTACALGQSCGADKPCPAGLVCNTNWGNKCTYGGIGTPCADDNECKQDSKHYCLGISGWWSSMWTRNACMVSYPWALCDAASSSTVCPAGYKCEKDPAYCKGDNYEKFGCKNSTIAVSLTQIALCVPNDFVCVCDCDDNDECAQTTTGGKFCNTNKYNYCSPGTYGSPCDNNTECTTNLCNTTVHNICTQGSVGESCSSDAECLLGNKCHPDAKVCVRPEVLQCPTR